MSRSHVNAPSSNTAAVITKSAPTSTNGYYLISMVQWSYSGTPTNGRLSIVSGSYTLLDVDITAGGPGFLPLDITVPKGAACTITLAAGGSGVSGKVNAQISELRSPL